MSPATQNTKKGGDAQRGKKTYDSSYLETNFTVEDHNILRLGMTKWKSPDGVVQRVYVSGQPANWPKGEPWVKLGYVAFDVKKPEDLYAPVEWGDMDKVTQELVKATCKALLLKP